MFHYDKQIVRRDCFTFDQKFARDLPDSFVLYPHLIPSLKGQADKHRHQDVVLVSASEMRQYVNDEVVHFERLALHLLSRIPKAPSGDYEVVVLIDPVTIRVKWTRGSFHDPSVVIYSITPEALGVARIPSPIQP
jgi:hypothetical protein